MRAGNLATVASLLLACLHSKIAVQVPEQYKLILVKERLTTSSSNPQGKFARPRLNKKKKPTKQKPFTLLFQGVEKITYVLGNVLELFK